MHLLSRLCLMVPCLLMACSKGDNASNNVQGIAGSDAGGSSAGEVGGATAVAGGTTAVAEGGAVAAGGSTASTRETCPKAIDIGVRMVGRYDGCVADGPSINWSGTGFVGAFTGTAVSVRLRETKPNHYTIVIDGVVGTTLITTSGEGTYVLGENLASGAHQVELYRRTEASQGITTILGVDVTGGTLAAPPAAPERNLEIVGDSITCGYGNEGANTSCSFTPDTENHYLAYGPLLARHFDAEVSTVAWSGKGVVWNYGNDTFNPIPKLYERSTVKDLRAWWDFSVKPQAVIINLGTNDYSSAKDPTAELFTSGYEALLTTIRGYYPDAYILCTVGPMLSGTDLLTARTNIAAAVTKRKDAGDTLVEAYEMQTGNPSPACDWHPSLTTHQAIADELATKLAAKLGW